MRRWPTCVVVSVLAKSEVHLKKHHLQYFYTEELINSVNMRAQAVCWCVITIESIKFHLSYVNFIL